MPRIENTEEENRVLYSVHMSNSFLFYQLFLTEPKNTVEEYDIDQMQTFCKTFYENLKFYRLAKNLNKQFRSDFKKTQKKTFLSEPDLEQIELKIRNISKKLADMEKSNNINFGKIGLLQLKLSDNNDEYHSKAYQNLQKHTQQFIQLEKIPTIQEKIQCAKGFLGMIKIDILNKRIQSAKTHMKSITELELDQCLKNSGEKQQEKFEKIIKQIDLFKRVFVELKDYDSCIYLNQNKDYDPESKNTVGFIIMIILFLIILGTALLTPQFIAWEDERLKNLEKDL